MESITKIEDNIHQICDEQLLKEIEKADHAIHASLTEWLSEVKKKVAAGDTTSDEDFLGILERSISELEKVIIGNSQPDSEFYTSLTERLCRELRDEVELEQDEGRFYPLPEDPAWVVMAKVGKRAARGILHVWDAVINGFKSITGSSADVKRTFTQQVPLQNIARYHFYTNERAAIHLSDFWNRATSQLLADLENVLIPNEEGKDPSNEQDLIARFQAFAESQQKRLDEKLGESQKRWLEFSVELEKEIVHAASRVDTIEHSRKYYSAERLSSSQDDLQALISSRCQRWTRAQQQVVLKLHPLIDFITYEHEIEAQFKKLVNGIDRYANSYLVEPVHSIIEKVEEAQARIQKAESGGKPKLKDHHDELLNMMQNKLLKPLSQALENRRFEHLLDQYIEKVLLRTNRLPEEIELYYAAEWEDYPPSYEVSVLQWQAIVTRRLNEELLNMLRKSRKNIRQQLETYYTEFLEVFDVIKVNLETSTGADQESEEESAGQVAVEGLERSVSKLQADLIPIEEDYATFEESIYQQLEEFEQQLWNLLMAKGAGDFQLKDTSYRVRKTTSEFKTQVEARSERLQDKVKLISRFSWTKLKKWYQQVSRFLGFETETMQEERKADIATYLSETDHRLQELPFVYRKLFSRDTEMERKFFVAPNESFGKVAKAYEMWKNNFGATCAIVGEKGAGKTTFVNLALQDLAPKETVKRISLNETIWKSEELLALFSKQARIKAESTQELIDKLNSRKSRLIIVIENLQNGYLRTINGYEALVNLLLLISATRSSVFWVISCSAYAWNLLDRVELAGEYFSHIITTDRLDKQQVQSVILRRHKVSGFELEFEADEVTQKSRAFRKLIDEDGSPQQYLEDRYFEKLADLAKGNASIALIFWIRSIREYDETHFYIEPLEVASVEVIDDLKPDVLFTLATLILHDTLSAEELSRTINIDERQTQLILARLEAKGLLLRTEKHYSLNHLMYRQVVDTLKQRNILHLV